MPRLQECVAWPTRVRENWLGGTRVVRLDSSLARWRKLLPLLNTAGCARFTNGGENVLPSTCLQCLRCHVWSCNRGDVQSAHERKDPSKGLAAMRDAGHIDGRLFEWGDSLRQERNIGAHASDQTVSHDDANDVLEFAAAICEYVYVLADRYRRYKERKPNP